jgi:hypothetical protein
MATRTRDQRNLNPHKPARLAMALYGDRYENQGGGSMDFWDSLTDGEKRTCREIVSGISTARDERPVEVHAAPLLLEPWIEVGGEVCPLAFQAGQRQPFGSIPPPDYIVPAFLPTVSLWQPWATWVTLGWKTVETRLHNRLNCLKGRIVAIHAARKWDNDARWLAAEYLSSKNWELSATLAEGNRGKIVAIAHIKDHRQITTKDELSRAMLQTSDLNLRTPRFGLFVDKLVPLPPFPLRGHQGIWYVRTSAIAERLPLFHLGVALHLLGCSLSGSTVPTDTKFTSEA